MQSYFFSAPHSSLPKERNQSNYEAQRHIKPRRHIPAPEQDHVSLSSSFLSHVTKRRKRINQELICAQDEERNTCPRSRLGHRLHRHHDLQPDGYMSTTVASSDTSLLPDNLNVTYPFQDGQTDADWAKAGRHVLSYSGPYAVRGNGDDAGREGAGSGTVVHGPLAVANVPPMKGTMQERNFTLVDTDEGRFLEILQESNGVRSQLWWKQAESECKGAKNI